MPRFKLTLEYDGAPFVGWQRQSNGLSVQEVIETALTPFVAKESQYAAPDARIPASMPWARSRMPISVRIGGAMFCATA